MGGRRRKRKMKEEREIDVYAKTRKTMPPTHPRTNKHLSYNVDIFRRSVGTAVVFEDSCSHWILELLRGDYQEDLDFKC